MDKESCDNCGSFNFDEEPTIIEYEDGTKEKNYDTLQAKCRECGKEWIIVYI